MCCATNSERLTRQTQSGERGRARPKPRKANQADRGVAAQFYGDVEEAADDRSVLWREVTSLHRDFLNSIDTGLRLRGRVAEAHIGRVDALDVMRVGVRLRAPDKCPET